MNPETAHNEIQTAVAAVVALNQYLTNQLATQDYLGAVDAAVAELPDGLVGLANGLAVVALRLAGLLAEATGQPIVDVLADLGSEAALRPDGEVG